LAASKGQSGHIADTGAQPGYRFPANWLAVTLAASPLKERHMNFLDSFEPQTKSILRIVTGLLFFSAGLAKILHFPSVPGLSTVMPTDWPEGYAGMIELIAGVFSRYAAFICSGEMAIAYFIGHFPKSPLPVINGGITAILFCFVFLYLAVAGPGPWTINSK
jgi:putative oxidoreductase